MSNTAKRCIIIETADGTRYFTAETYTTHAAGGGDGYVVEILDKGAVVATFSPGTWLGVWYSDAQREGAAAA